ncbi:MAG: zf-TFIIB domain-containing protein [Candidatus Hydrogenedentes bacterium]|nr:zf-TFIIB domain-containing protein [Candidatus Hydrogenedentota bacterium]
MKCPACNELMIVVEYDRIEVDCCVVCSGVWLDAGEIELLFGDHAAWDRLISSGRRSTATQEKVRRCPACRKKMDKLVAGTDTPVTFDRCPRGEGLWFDQGELDTLLRHGRVMTGGETVTSFLAEVFQGRNQANSGG